tara:strand:- start:141 stop:341 length:201 start_codon:yes stop_codon:yes gene_type:complete
MLEVSCQILPVLLLVLLPEDTRQVKDTVIMVVQARATVQVVVLVPEVDKVLGSKVEEVLLDIIHLR